jgi:hypothetical protein
MIKSKSDYCLLAILSSDLERCYAAIKQITATSCSSAPADEIHQASQSRLSPRDQRGVSAKVKRMPRMPILRCP